MFRLFYYDENNKLHDTGFTSDSFEDLDQLAMDHGYMNIVIFKLAIHRRVY